MQISGGRERGVVATTATVLLSSLSSPTDVTAIVTTKEKDAIEGKAEIPGRDVSVSGMTESAKGSKEAPDLASTPLYVTQNFKLVFVAVLLITVASGLAQFFIAMKWPQATPNVQSTFESFGFAWKAGLGAIFGLLGGKVT